MEKIQINCRIEAGDFRKATYYGLFVRYRTPFRILFIVLIVGILYAIGGQFGLGEINPLVLMIAAGYVVWGLLMFAGTERSIIRYLRTPDCLVGCEYQFGIDVRNIRIKIPQRNVDISLAVSKLTCVFELHSLFMIYISGQQVYLLPKRYLSAQQCGDLRKIFQNSLQDRFSSRFR
ncbi:MAG: YcxB family protein [Clostridiales bacterium]|nr:YcxB family protein [Clostridiales bacterium]